MYERLDPPDKPCWVTCRACYRCQDKGTHYWCETCTGRADSRGRRVDPLDTCRCTDGILQWRTKTGNLIRVPYRTNPFKRGTIEFLGQSPDERDWESYKQEMREKFDDEHWDPVQFYER